MSTIIIITPPKHNDTQPHESDQPAQIMTTGVYLTPDQVKAVLQSAIDSLSQ